MTTPTDEATSISVVTSTSTATPTKASKCHRCKKSVGGGKVISANKKSYHVDCFSCAGCSMKLALKFCEIDDQPHCSQCALDKYAPKCYDCQKPIEGKECVRILGHDYHPECPKCHGCRQPFNGEKFYPWKESAYCFTCQRKVRLESHHQHLLHRNNGVQPIAVVTPPIAVVTPPTAPSNVEANGNGSANVNAIPAPP